MTTPLFSRAQPVQEASLPWPTWRRWGNLFVGKRAASDDPTAYVDFVAAGRFKETVGAETYTGSYSYSNTGVNTGDVVLKYDDGDRQQHMQRRRELTT